MRKLIYLLTLTALMGCVEKKISTTDVVQRGYLIQLLESPPEDKIQVINFWATWCRPCVEELPAFIELDKRSDVEVILISLDEAKNKDTMVDPFLEMYQITSTVKLLDDPYAAEWIPMVDQHWDGAIPATLIQKGSKKMFYNKPFTAAELEEEVAKFL